MPRTYPIDLNASPLSEQLPPSIYDIGFPHDCGPGEFEILTNPWLSPTAEAPADPVKDYGFRLVETGGGCTALELIWDGDEEEEYLLTSAGDPMAPTSSADGWMLSKSIGGGTVWTLTVGPDGKGTLEDMEAEADPVVVLRDASIRLANEAAAAVLEMCNAAVGLEHDARTADGITRDQAANRVRAIAGRLSASAREVKETAESFYGWE